MVSALSVSICQWETSDIELLVKNHGDAYGW
jgi:hypothetical protein